MAPPATPAASSAPAAPPVPSASPAPPPAAPASSPRTRTARTQDDSYKKYKEDQLRQKLDSKTQAANQHQRTIEHYGSQKKEHVLRRTQAADQLNKDLPAQERLLDQKLQGEQNSHRAQQEELATQQKINDENKKILEQRRDLVETKQRITARQKAFYFFVKIWESIQGNKRQEDQAVMDMYKAFTNLNAAGLQVAKISGGQALPPTSVPVEPTKDGQNEIDEKELAALKSEQAVKNERLAGQARALENNATRFADDHKRKKAELDLNRDSLKRRIAGEDRTIQLDDERIAAANKDHKKAQDELAEFKRKNPKVKPE